MKPIVLQKTFEKMFVKRILHDKKLSEVYETRITLFICGERGYPVNDHALTGSLKGKRAFSIAGDIRVIYIETEDAYHFIDIGSHNQVY